MKKSMLRALSAAMCLIMVLGLLGGCSTGQTDPAPEQDDPAIEQDDHDHTDDVVDLPGEEDVPLAGGNCNGHHTWGKSRWETTTFCPYGECEAFFTECTVCGARSYIAFRKYKKSDGEHKWGATVTFEGSCPDNPSTERVCTVCKQVETTIKSHTWEEKVIKPATCSENGITEKTCKCGATETVYTPKLSHTWGEPQTKDPTCTEEGGIVTTCTKCGEKKITGRVPALGHNWVAKDPNDQSKGEHCSRCGVENTGPKCEHIWGANWKSNESSHWLVCVYCGLKDAKSIHVDKDNNNKCDVCGYVLATEEPECQHVWTVVAPFGTMNHYEKCTLCGGKRQVNCYSAGKWKPRDYCTDPTYCECGNKVKDGQKRHNFGTWICNDATHTHKCLNIGCKYGETSNHEVAVASEIDCTASGVCVVCNVAVAAAYTTHEYGPWESDGNGGHVRKCLHEGCEHTEYGEHEASNANYCTSEVVCKLCGEVMTKGTGSHNYGDWTADSDGTHYRSCTNPGCEAVEREGHTPAADDGNCTTPIVCTVCGAELTKGSTGHEYGAWTSDGTGGHVRTCVHEGCKQTEQGKHVAADRTDCTADVVCKICGAVMTKGNASHNYGAWTADSDGTHSRTCTNPGCKAVEHGSHTSADDDGSCTTPITCTVCGAQLTNSYSTHEYGAWISDGNGGHKRTCVHSGCHATETADHTGGVGNCKGEAVCADCGASYQVIDPSNHVGGTTIKDAKPADVGVEGYTGDTVCLGCGAVLQKGEKIDALKPDHVHAFGETWKTDSSGHWHECECGEKQDAAAHTFEKGVCTVCGEKDPDYVEVHVHKIADVWKTDLTSHWHICETCGEVVDKAGHLFINDVCVDCGMTFERREVMEQTAQERAAAEETLKTETEENVVVKFDDVKENAYYTLPIQRLVSAGLMKGTGDNTFNVKGTATRIQVMAIIARMNKVEGADSDDWSKAKKAIVAWADANGIAATDHQGDAITREELVLMLWRNAGKPESHRDLSYFVDADALKGDVRAAMAWAVEEGIILGDNNRAITPTATATRGQIATILARYMDTI